MNRDNCFSFSCNFFFKSSILINKSFLLTSTRTTFAPVNFTALAVAGKVIFGTRTSSSGKTLIALSAKKIAEVPLVEVITYFVLSNEDIFFQNFS